MSIVLSSRTTARVVHSTCRVKMSSTLNERPYYGLLYDSQPRMCNILQIWREEVALSSMEQIQNPVASDSKAFIFVAAQKVKF